MDHCGPGDVDNGAAWVLVKSNPPPALTKLRFNGQKY